MLIAIGGGGIETGCGGIAVCGTNGGGGGMLPIGGGVPDGCGGGGIATAAGSFGAFSTGIFVGRRGVELEAGTDMTTGCGGAGIDTG